jgi:Right handed beta helix region
MRSKQGVAILSATVAIAAVVAALPAAASAASLWVAHAPTVKGPGKSCTSPGYSTIQSAIAADTTGAKIEVCTGTYIEQLQITKGLSIVAAGSVTVRLPATPVDSTTECDKASLKGLEEHEYGDQPNQDLVAICGAGTVTITGLTFEGNWPAGTCDDSLYGILVGGGADLKLTDSTISGAGADPINGCQGGIGVQVGMAWTNPVEIGTATLTNDTIGGYQKNGITVDGPGSKATITSTTVTGAGETPAIAQNGIQVSNGAQAKITGSTISGNEYNPGYEATGVLFYGAAAGSSVTKSIIDDNDFGVYYLDGLPTPPTSSQLTISGDKLTNDRYASVGLDQGWATVSSDELAGGKVGILVFQYDEQQYGPKGTGSGDTISGMSEWAVQGSSDENPADHPGSFSIVKSSISGNPLGASVSNSVTSNSKSLSITTASSDS